jgi:hypothetical protein
LPPFCLIKYFFLWQLLAITLDNAANNGVFVRELATKLKAEENIEWDSEHLRFRCLNHVLNLAVQAALDQIQEDVRQVLKFFFRNPNPKYLPNDRGSFFFLP